VDLGFKGRDCVDSGEPVGGGEVLVDFMFRLLSKWFYCLFRGGIESNWQAIWNCGQYWYT